jgi:hypothetical protein
LLSCVLPLVRSEPLAVVTGRSDDDQGHAVTTWSDQRAVTTCSDDMQQKTSFDVMEWGTAGEYTDL